MPTLVSAIDRRVFDALYATNLVYNACWEDPALDQVALELKPHHRVLTVTSAGCNALDYALAGPRVVHAVDANPRQNALLELKLAGIRALDHGDFFACFGAGAHPRFEVLYAERLRQHLTPFARRFWDHRGGWFSGRGWRSSLYFHGLSGLVARLVCTYLRRERSLRRAVDDLLEVRDLATQRWIYDQQVAPRLWTPRLLWAISRPTTLSLLGVPGPQAAEVARAHVDGVAGFIRASVDRVFRELPLWTNYFWSVYLRGSYTPGNCPRYLSPAGFAALKGGLVDRIQVHTGSVAGFLADSPLPIHRYVLLDHLDWMAYHDHDGLVEEWERLRRRAAPDTRVIFRSAHPDPAFLASARLADGRSVLDGLRFQRDLADQLHALDRVGTYGGFHIADLV